MMQLGVDGVFVGSGIFKSGDPAKRAAAIVKAVTTTMIHISWPRSAAIWVNDGWEKISSIPDAELIALVGGNSFA
jgi:pyridoxal 5'-phosphate synthase pdxS subunit